MNDVLEAARQLPLKIHWSIGDEVFHQAARLKANYHGPRSTDASHWQWCTSDGAELHTLLMGLKTTFREKLEWLEEAETLTSPCAPAAIAKPNPVASHRRGRMPMSRESGF